MGWGRNAPALIFHAKRIKSDRNLIVNTLIKFWRFWGVEEDDLRRQIIGKRSC